MESNADRYKDCLEVFKMAVFGTIPTQISYILRYLEEKKTVYICSAEELSLYSPLKKYSTMECQLFSLLQLVISLA